jgi:hypothetical protein
MAGRCYKAVSRSLRCGIIGEPRRYTNLVVKRGNHAINSSFDKARIYQMPQSALRD